MSLKNIFKAPSEGIVEVEESYVRFVAPGKKGYLSKTVPVNQTDPVSVVRENIEKAMGSTRQISVITNYQTGHKILPFPPGMEKADILEHLRLKKEEYFGVKNECDFMLREASTKDKESQGILVSYVQKRFLNQLSQICSEKGFTLNRVINFAEAMTGAYQLQCRGKPGEYACLLAIGYYNVNMVVLKNGIPVAVRTSLTGSVKEVENRLMSVLKLEKSKVTKLLGGETEDADQESIDLLQQNERELLSRIAPFFAYLRSIGIDTSKVEIFLTMPYVALSGLPGLLRQNFQGEVTTLDAANKKPVKDPEVNADFDWLMGAFYRHVLSFTTLRPPFFRFTVSTRMAWMFVIFFLTVPMGLATLSKQMSKNQMLALQSRYSEVLSLFERSERNTKKFEELTDISNVLEREVNSSRPVTPLIRHISDMIEPEVRLEEMSIERSRNRLTLKGIAIDNESALELWTKIEKMPEAGEVRIELGDRTGNESVSFTINAAMRY